MKRRRQLVMRAAAAQALGVSPARISQWISDGAPVARRGRRGRPALYDVQRLRRWRAARERQQNADGLSLEIERAKLTRAQRLKVERENRVRAGELLERVDVTADIVAMVKATRARLLILPAHAVRRGIVAREKEAALRALVVEVLTELSNWRGLEDVRRTMDAAASEGGLEMVATS
jgi:phage terminase Nu1 subunit (DNA packaging protein)